MNQFDLKEFQLSQPLNNRKTIFLASKDQEQYVLKKYTFQQQRIGKHYLAICGKYLSVSHSGVIKPSGYFYSTFSQLENEQPKSFNIFLKKYKYSLEDLLIIKKANKCYFSSTQIKNLTSKLFTVFKVFEQLSILHLNLKPSNIFWDDLDWVVSQTGFITQSLSKMYSAPQIQLNQDKPSQQFLENLHNQAHVYILSDIYSIGAILIQMARQQMIISLQNIEDLKLYRTTGITQSQVLKKNKILKDIGLRYGIELKHLIQILIQPYPVQRRSIKELISQYKNFKNNQEDFQPNNSTQILKYISPKFDIQKINQKFGFIQFFQKHNNCVQILTTFIQNDLQLNLELNQFSKLINVLSALKYPFIQDRSVTFGLWKFYLQDSMFKYINLIKNHFPFQAWLPQLLRNFIKKLSYNNFYKQIANQNGKVDMNSLIKFLKMIAIEVNQDDMVPIFQKSKQYDKEQFAKYIDVKPQFYQSNIKRPHPPNQKNTLKYLLAQLSEKIHPQSLFQFFNKFDQNNKFVVDSRSVQRIKDILDEKNFQNMQKCLRQLWIVGGVGQQKQYLRYLKVIKTQMKIFSLFVYVFNSIIKRQKSFQSFFQKYAKLKQYWDYQSLQDWNQQYMIQFSGRELQQIFSELDKKKDHKIFKQQLLSQVQLPNNLSNDQIIQTIKIKLGQKDPFDHFKYYDVNKDLYYNSYQQLYQGIINLDLKITKRQCQDFFRTLTDKETLSLVSFSLHFMQPYDLFKKVIHNLIENQQYYDFQKIFSFGDSNNDGRWQQISLQKVNQKLDLGFNKSHLACIWKNLDVKKYVTLTKADVMYKLDIKQDDYKTIESQVKKEVQLQHQKKLRQSRKKSTIIDNKRHKNESLALNIHLEKKPLMQQLKKRKENILQYFFEADDNKDLIIQKKTLKKCLGRMEIQFTEQELNLLFKTHRRQEKFDYFKLMMTISEVPSYKAKFTSVLLKQTMLNIKCSIRQLMNIVTKDKWRIQHLCMFLEKLKLNVDYIDIQQIWREWDVNGSNELDERDLQMILDRQVDKQKVQQQMLKSKQIYENRNQRKGGKKITFNPQGLNERNEENNITKQRKRNKQFLQKKQQNLPNTKHIKSQEVQVIDPRYEDHIIQKQNTFSQNLGLLKEAVSKKGYHFQKYNKNVNYLSQKQFLFCLQQIYQIKGKNAINLFKNLHYANNVNLQTLKEKLQVPVKRLPSSKIFGQSHKLKSLLRKKTLPIKDPINTLIQKYKQKYKSLEGIVPFFFQDKQIIDKDLFKSKVYHIYPQLSQPVIQQIFDSCDPNSIGTMNIVTFRSVFIIQPQIKERKNEVIMFPQQIQKELQKIFRSSDIDKSNGITENQLQKLLHSLGLNIGLKSIQDYFKQIDVDASQNIDYEEFKSFFQKNIFLQIFSIEDIFDKLKQQLEIADIFNKKKLTQQQFLYLSLIRHVFKKINLKISPQQFAPLFIDLDLEKQNLASIKLFLRTLTQPNLLSTAFSKNAIYKILVNGSMSLNEIRRYFGQLPICYSLSLLYGQLKKLKNLPSDAIRPVLDQSRLFFKDLKYKNIYQKQKNRNLLAPNKQNNLISRITFVEATGIPLPSTNIILRSNILKRTIICSVYDPQLSKVLFNCCTIQGIWDQDNQNDWKFQDPNRYSLNNKIFVKMGSYNSSHAYYQLLIQFVISVNAGQKILQINCGSGAIPLKDIFNSPYKQISIPIQGGVPDKKLEIKKEDIQGKKSFWKNVFKGERKSEVMLIIENAHSFSQQSNQLSYLPQNIVINQRSLNLFRYFRQYFAEISIINFNIDINSKRNRKITNFLYAVDCPQIFRKLIHFWNSQIMQIFFYSNKIRVAADGRFYIDMICAQLPLAIQCREFNFKEHYPTYEALNNSLLLGIRVKLVEQLFNDCKLIIKGQTMQKYIIRNALAYDHNSYKAFKMQFEEEDNYLDNLIMKLKRQNA